MKMKSIGSFRILLFIVFEISFLMVFCKCFAIPKTTGSGDAPGLGSVNVQQIITGTVKDALGNPLFGVSITVKGTTKGTSTNQNGEFRIQANKNDVLIFSYVGYTEQEIQVNESTTIDVVLSPSAAELNEVVIVGYGQQKKINATGAVATIDNKILENRPMARISQGLQGAIANLNISTQYGGGAPNSTQSFNIRGYTGLGTSQGPLIVIDGVQGGDINALNPNDIESISVIKDAAAAAVYGSSAPYGVILITTKKGKSGKMQVTYNNTITLNTPIGMPKMMNSLEHALMYNETSHNGGGGDIFSPNTLERIKEYIAGTLTTETEPDPTPGTDQWRGWGTSNANNDWYKIYYKKVQVEQQHNLSFSGGSEKTNYYVGLGYNDRPGMLTFGHDIYKRYNVRANISSKVIDWLQVGLRTYYSKESYDAPWSGGGRTGGNWMHQLGRKWPSIALFTPATANAPRSYSELSDVPLMTEGGRHIESWDKPTITGEIVLTPVKGLSATINYTYDAGINQNSDHTKTVYTPQPSGTLVPIDFTYPNGFSRSTGFRYHQVLNAFADYTIRINEHHFKLLGGYVREVFDNMFFSGGNNNLFTDNVPAISTSFGKSPSVTDSRYQLASEGVFGRFNYNYREKYLLEVTGRYDGSSRFLPDSRWRFYPGVSAGWNMDKENFWEELGIRKTINAFKIRGSYGSLGDQSFGDPSNTGNWYPFYPTLGTATPTNSNWYFAGGREARTGAPGLVNPDITWVTTNTLDFGIDASALNYRLSLTFDWYKRNAKNYLGPARDYPAVLGTNPPQENAAAVETKGFDMTIGWKDHIGNVSYSLRGTLSNYKGFVTEYPNEQKLISNWYSGEPMGAIYGYTTVGYFQSDEQVSKAPDQSKIYSSWGPGDIQYADLDNNNRIDWGANTVENMGDLRIIGNSTPQFQFGLFGSVEWQNFDASFFLQGVGHRDFFPGSGINYFWGVPGSGSQWQSSLFTVHRDRWTPSNPDGYFPKYYLNSGETSKNMQTQTKYLQNAAYIRFKNIQVGYTLPKDLLKQVGVTKLRVFVLVENLGVISPLKRHSNIDPETFFSDMKIYPLQRGYSAGVNITF